MKKLVAILGPTGVGKSRLALEIGERLGGEIISADSRQVYRSMDIGTDKPAISKRAQIPHYGIDIVNPDDSFSLANFTDIVAQAIEIISHKGKIPLLVGGTGQYVWAIIEGWEIPRIKPNIELRNQLEERAARGEADTLYRDLEEISPEAAARIDPRNTRRVIRALEVAITGGISRIQEKNPKYNSLIIGLTAPRNLLYQMIDERVDRMIHTGLKEEVEELLRLGYSPDLPSMSGIGYRQIIRYLKGKCSLSEAIISIKNDSHRLVRMQYNWFSLHDTRIKWFDITQPDYTDTIIGEVKGFINNP